MTQSVIHKLGLVDENSAYSVAEKLKRYKDVLEECRAQGNGLLDWAMRGHTTIPQELVRLREELGESRFLYPHVLGDKKYARSSQELASIIGPGETSDFANIVANPVSFAAISAVPTGITEAMLYKQLNRRTLLAAASSLVFAVPMGALVCGIRINEPLTAANYVQEKIELVQRCYG